MCITFSSNKIITLNNLFTHSRIATLSEHWAQHESKFTHLNRPFPIWSSELKVLHFIFSVFAATFLFNIRMLYGKRLTPCLIQHLNNHTIQLNKNVLEMHALMVNAHAICTLHTKNNKWQIATKPTGRAMISLLFRLQYENRADNGNVIYVKRSWHKILWNRNVICIIYFDGLTR